VTLSTAYENGSPHFTNRAPEAQLGKPRSQEHTAILVGADMSVPQKAQAATPGGTASPRVARALPTGLPPPCMGPTCLTQPRQPLLQGALNLLFE
jgi:hypothetical protein